MAEAVFRQMVKENGLEEKIQVDSAGTGHWHVGETPHRGTQSILKKHNIDFTGIKARQIKSHDFRKFQYIVVMDGSNFHNVKQWNEQDNVMIKRLLDYTNEYDEKDVPDPYYTGNFQEVYEMVQKGCQGLLEDIRMREKL